MLCSVSKRSSFREVPGLIWVFFFGWEITTVHSHLAVLKILWVFLGNRDPQAELSRLIPQKKILSNIFLWCLAHPNLGGMHQEINSAEGDKCDAHSLVLSLTSRGKGTELESLVQGQSGDQRDVTLRSQLENHIQCHSAHDSRSFYQLLLILAPFQ